MKLQFKDKTLLFRDEFTVADFCAVHLPPIDLVALRDQTRPMTNTEMEGAIGWIQHFLIHMASNDETKQYLSHITFTYLAQLVQDQDLITLLQTCFGGMANV